jgi:hypothetical protein
VTGVSPVKFRDRHIDKHARTRTSPSSTCIEGPRCGEIPTPVLLYDQMGKSSSNRASNNVSLFPLSHTTWQALAQIERAASKLFDLAAARVRGLSAAFLGPRPVAACLLSPLHPSDSGLWFGFRRSSSMSDHQALLLHRGTSRTRLELTIRSRIMTSEQAEPRSHESSQ